MKKQLAEKIRCFQLMLFCLDAVEVRQKAGHLSKQQQEEFEALKNQIEALNYIDQQLLELTQKTQRILSEIQLVLEVEIENIRRSSKTDCSEETTNKRVSLEAQIEEFSKFKNYLKDDRQLAKWLEKYLDSIAKKLGDASIKKHKKLKSSYDQNHIDSFYWEIKQYLERIAYCLKVGTYDCLDEPEPSLSFPLYAYKTAFNSLLSQRFPEYISQNSIDQLKDCITYLFTHYLQAD